MAEHFLSHPKHLKIVTGLQARNDTAARYRVVRDFGSERGTAAERLVDLVEARLREAGVHIPPSRRRLKPPGQGRAVLADRIRLRSGRLRPRTPGTSEDMDRTGAPVPALATLCHEPFFADGWVYERKLDGERCLAVRDAAGTRLLSRSGRDISPSFPEIVEAVERHAEVDFVIDGEVVAFEGSRTSFARLQPRIQVNEEERARASGVPVYYYIFDLLEADGDDLRPAALLDRKRKLRQALRFTGPLRYTPHRVHADHDYFGTICGRGWEGLIAKRTGEPYRPGRSNAWLKFKCEAGQELIIVGYTDPAGSRVALGALLLGYYSGDDLVYAGKVGTGFSQQVLRDLHRRLSAAQVDRPTCTRGQLPRAGVHWVEPKLVAEIAFTEWTRAGQLRHPRYLGLRRDKRPADVVRE